MSIKRVIDFWFGEIRESADYLNQRFPLWFSQNHETDRAIHEQFETLYETLAKEGAAEWANSAIGRLAAIIVLDQFPRNLFRNSPKAFATDPTARQLTLAGLDLNHDKLLHPIQRIFFYLPLEHSEGLADQERSIALFTQTFQNAPPPLKETLEMSLNYSLEHYEIIKRFGRFPHRNKVLGRVSTPEEAEFLKTFASF